MARPSAATQELGLVAVLPVSAVLADRGGWGSWGGWGQRGWTLGSAIHLDHALEEPIEALATRIDDAGILEDGQQLGRPLDRIGSRGDDLCQHGLHVWPSFGGSLRCRRRHRG